MSAILKFISSVIGNVLGFILIGVVLLALTLYLVISALANAIS